MNLYQWLCVLGIPAVTGAVLMRILSKGLNRMERRMDDTAIAQSLGLQALLRSQLYEIYGRCRGQGFATHSDRENFENIYRQYHRLGANGVMDDTRRRMMDLPIGGDGI